MGFKLQTVYLCLELGLAAIVHDENTRPEIESFVQLIKPIIWHGEGIREGSVFKTHGVFYVPDPYQEDKKRRQRVRGHRSSPSAESP
jgi:hypothetical protein